MMNKIIFILGGARSGKSSYAVKLAKKFKKRVVFIATCVFLDDEMKKRIKLHKNLRPKNWRMVEEGKDINRILMSLGNKYDIALIDCLGIWISNLLSQNLNDRKIEWEINRFAQTILKIRLTTILVSNEVGCGIIPDNSLARRFRDLLGMLNQKIAKIADEVIFMVSGIPQNIKIMENNYAKIR